jgi:hypothetical protein
MILIEEHYLSAPDGGVSYQSLEAALPRITIFMVVEYLNFWMLSIGGG